MRFAADYISPNGVAKTDQSATADALKNQAGQGDRDRK
jgi:hypothetical protein